MTESFSFCSRLQVGFCFSGFLFKLLLSAGLRRCEPADSHAKPLFLTAWCMRKNTVITWEEANHITLVRLTMPLIRINLVTMQSRTFSPSGKNLFLSTWKSEPCPQNFSICGAKNMSLRLGAIFLDVTHAPAVLNCGFIQRCVAALWFMVLGGRERPAC